MPKRSVILLALLLLVFTTVKIPFLFLPYYYDEVWPYSAAIDALLNHGLSLSPDSIPPELSRGHPLLFHFCAALWMKVFGSSIVSGHAFILFVSILLVIEIYLFCRDFFSENIALISCFLFTVQSAFLAQSVFLLPEIFLSLWVLLSLHFFLKEKYFLFFISATALLLTKESGIVLIAVLMAWKAREFFLPEKNRVWIQLAWIFSPLLIASLFFIAQKLQHGWFFFPHHMNLLSFKAKTFTEELPTAAAYLFIYHGRNGLSLFILIGLGFLIFRKESFATQEKQSLLLMTFFLLSFLLFSATFYFIPRYLMPALPLFVIAGSVIIFKAFFRYKVVFFLMLAGMATTHVIFCFHKPEVSEFKYLPMVSVQQQMVQYCEERQLWDKHIFAILPICFDLTEMQAGYLKEKEFTNIQEYYSGETEYCIISNEEFDKEKFEALRTEADLKLLKRFEKDYAWTEIYEVEKKP